MAWTSIINGQTGLEVSQKLDTEFLELETSINDLETNKADKAELALMAYSNQTQEPSELGVPMQVLFGSLQENSFLRLDNNGDIVFKQSGHYHLQIRFHYGRDNSNGTSLLFARVTKNGTQIGGGSVAKLSSSNVLLSGMHIVPIDIEVDDTIKVEVIRDSAGDNSGGLFATTSSHGWNTANSAEILIYKYA